MTSDGTVDGTVVAEIRATLLSFLLIVVGLFAFALAIRVSPGRASSSDAARGSKSPRDSSSRKHSSRSLTSPRSATQLGILSRRDSTISRLKEELDVQRLGSSMLETGARSGSVDAWPSQFVSSDADRPPSSRSSHSSFWSKLDEDRDTTLMRAGSVMSEYLLAVDASDGYGSSGSGGGGCSSISNGLMHLRYPAVALGPGKQRRASGSIYRRACSSPLQGTESSNQLASRMPGTCTSILELRDMSPEQLQTHPHLRSCISEDLTATQKRRPGRGA